MLHTLMTISRSLPRTWRTPLLYHALDGQVECLAAELPSPHVDEGYFTHEDGQGSIRSLFFLIRLESSGVGFHVP